MARPHTRTELLATEGSLPWNSTQLNELPAPSLAELAWQASTELGPCPLALLLDALAHRVYVEAE